MSEALELFTDLGKVSAAILLALAIIAVVITAIDYEKRRRERRWLDTFFRD